MISKKVWLTKKGYLSSNRNKQKKDTMKLYMEGYIVAMQPHYEGDRYWFRVQWQNKQFGTYYSDSGLVTQHKPKVLKKNVSGK